MTRVLSELLGASGLGFRLGLRQLEQAAGRPNEDIRLGCEVEQHVREHLRELGLDPRDTTGPELYGALQERLKHDEGAVRELIGYNSPDENLMQAMQSFLRSLEVPKKTFALKASVAKRLLKANPPKKAMRQLGYRSLDSMLKHEPVPQLYAACAIIESATWHKHLLTQYKQLVPTDFEVREIQIIAPDTRRWQTLGAAYIRARKQNILTFKELGAMILLPLRADTMPGAALASLLLALHALNDIRTTSAFLKLHQVRPDFGGILAQAVRDEPYTHATLVNGQRLPWALLQEHFAQSPETFVPELFEPHVQREDLQTVPPEQVLADLHPRFEFWRGLGHVGLLYQGEPVSFNLTDAALNFCNQLPFERRLVHFFRRRLWYELMGRYLHQKNLEKTVHEQLDDELVDEKALA